MVPLQRQSGVMVPLFKKGSQRVCSNYREIAPLSLTRNVYAKRRIGLKVEPQIQEEQ